MREGDVERESNAQAILCNSVASFGFRHVASTAFSGSWARALTKPRPIPREALCGVNVH